MKRIEEAIQRANEFLHREVEKRVVLETLPPECKDAKKQEIRQGFIRECREDNKPYCDVRIRETDGKDYTLTAKFRPKHQEATTKISKEMFDALWPGTRSKQEKKRYILENGWIVDEIDNGRIVAEFEYKDGKDKAYRPASFEVKEVIGRE